jgi:ribose transport system substrate-binding protein
MIAQHVDGLAVAAAERKALVQSIDRAVSLGIPVAVFDSGVDSTNYLTFIATNNYDAGQMAARELAKLLNGKGSVAIIMHEPGSASTMDRERGFDDLMTKEFPGINVVARQYGHSDRSKARSAAENILAAHPDLDGMFASSEPSSVGAALAIKSRALGGKIKFVAFDSSESLIEDLKADVITAMVVQDPFKMGFEAVKVLVDKLNGINPAKRIDLAPTVVEKQDLDKPEIKELLYPDVKKYLK